MTAKLVGEESRSCDPAVSEWGNPSRFIAGYPVVKISIYRDIATGEGTWGTETSKYLEEKKSIEIPLVAASENGRA